MKILLLGNTGQVGWELHRTMLTLGEVIALDYPQINMADPKNIQAIVRDAHPDIIVNATAYTDVDQAESLPELAMAINGTGPGILAEEAQKLNAVLIHYSTDYVFDGSKGAPYTEKDATNPINVYGETKLAGEHAVQAVGGAHLIFRTSWVYSLRRPCFVTKVLKWAREHETLRIVDDQVGSPTWARTLAEATAQIIAQGREDPVAYLMGKTGLYHLAGGGVCSRYEWAKSILEYDPDRESQIVEQLLRAKSEEFPTPVERPSFSILDCSFINSKLSIFLMSWEKCISLSLKK